jgi:Putative silver efflux pump
LIEGAIIVFLVLIVFLGNVRAGMIVASVIPLSMLFGFILMRLFNVSANLMSLGAIDFGIVVDGSIVIVEGILAHLYGKSMVGRNLSQEMMDREIETGAGQVVRSATFAVGIILIVYFPILTLQGIEGKYFTYGQNTGILYSGGVDIVAYVCTYDGFAVSKKRAEADAYAGRSFLRLVECVLPKDLELVYAS